jgi:hypothetical protein
MLFPRNLVGGLLFHEPFEEIVGKFRIELL